MKLSSLICVKIFLAVMEQGIIDAGNDIGMYLFNIWRT
jgi:hypothetical protein